MALINVKIDIDLSKIEKLIDTIKKIKPLIGEIVTTQTIERFTTKENPKLGKWKKLSDKTIKARSIKRNKPVYNTEILEDTNILKNSIHYEIDDDKILIGSAIGYGQYHQYGTRRGLPKDNEEGWRGFLGLNDNNIKEIEDVIKEAFEYI